jgi:hypothetical protein
MTTNTPACVTHLPEWLDAAEADDLFAALTTRIPWSSRVPGCTAGKSQRPA